MLQKLFNNGGRKFWMVGGMLIAALLNSALGLGISEETINACLLAAVAGSGTIALEDGIRALFGVKEKTDA
jgi:hypothetical protein